VTAVNIIEALTLAKNEKKKVRPVAWVDGSGSHYLWWNGEQFMRQWKHSILGETDSQILSLNDPDELLGEWEVVP
jgi:hypothetical protein